MKFKEEWSWNEETEERRYLEELLRRQNDAAQAQAQQQAFHQAAVFGSGQIHISQGSTSHSDQFTFTQTNQAHYGISDTFYGARPRQRNPNQEGENFIYSLNRINPTYIKEMVILEHVYMQLVAIMGYDSKAFPKIEKELTYNNSYGSLLLKNQKYQFDLDKYIEDGPIQELVE